MNAGGGAERAVEMPRAVGAPAATSGEATRFLARLDPHPGAHFTFQTFDDDSKRKDKLLARILHGTLEKHAAELARLNKRGAGVFVTVNETDGRGRKAENVTRIRAVFVDLDGAPCEPVKACKPTPHIIVESSPGRWHAYWLVDGLPRDDFTPLQKTLASRFNADGSVHDLPRVMRLPGFMHRKREPFPVRVQYLSDVPNYRVSDLLDAFDVDEGKAAARRYSAPIVGTIEDGQRNVALTSLAGTVRGRGCGVREIYALLSVANDERCRPPMSDPEVRAIVQSVMRYSPGKAWWAAAKAEDAAADEWLAEVHDEAVARWVGAS